MKEEPDMLYTVISYVVTWAFGGFVGASLMMAFTPSGNRRMR
jgi:hypothetical protein